MRVIVRNKRTKAGKYVVYSKNKVKIAVVDRLNLTDAYRTKINDQEALCGLYNQYSEDVDAYHKLSDVDNLALDTVVMTGHEIYVMPSGTLRLRN